MNVLVLGKFDETKKNLNDALKARGFEVVHAESLKELEALPFLEKLDLVLMENTLSLPEVHENFSQRFLLIKEPQELSPSSKKADTTPHLSLNAFKLLSRDFDFDELDQILREPEVQPRREEVIRIEGLLIDSVNRLVHFNGKPIGLTDLEFDLLFLLAKNKGRVLSTTRLLSQVWGLQHDPQSPLDPKTSIFYDLGSIWGGFSSLF